VRAVCAFVRVKLLGFEASAIQPVLLGKRRTSVANRHHTSSAKAELPDPDRRAMIWVTHDLKRYDSGEPGGLFEMLRMLCFGFADGSGGSAWPIDPTWKPPVSEIDQNAGRRPCRVTSLLAALTAAVLIGLSAVAFRRRG
jgi:hypothetical protein